MSYESCEGCGANVTNAPRYDVCGDCRRRVVQWPYVYAVFVVAREVLAAVEVGGADGRVRSAALALRSALDLADTVRNATGRDGRPRAWTCDHVKGVRIEIPRTGGTIEWCSACGSTRGRLTHGPAASVGTWGTWIVPRVRGDGVASILESLGHNSTAAPSPDRSGVEKPNSAEQFSTAAPSSELAAAAKGGSVSHLEDSSDSGKAASWEVIEARAVVERFAAHAVAAPLLTAVGSAFVVAEIAVRLQAAHAKGWEEARTRYEALEHDRRRLREGFQRARALREERDQARKEVADLRALAETLDEIRALKERADDRKALATELETTKALLRRAVGVINDVDKARDEAAAVLNAFADLEPSSLIRTLAEYRERHPIEAT